MTQLTGRVFCKVMAADLFQTSPWCQAKLGQPLGPASAIVDAFGYIRCTVLPFNIWQTRHDAIILAITERVQDSKLNLKGRFSLFADIVPALTTKNRDNLEMVY